jgi:Caffeine-induced death protein 2
MRSDVLNYCAGVATSPDPDDPDSLLREVENARARERIVNERLDPYSGRYFPREARTESLASLVRNERAVEEIIRSRTWSIITERCGSGGRSFEQALDEWRISKERPQPLSGS